MQGNANENDDSKLAQLKRTTPAAIVEGMVKMLDNDIQSMPTNELAKDCVMPEGPGTDFEIICRLLLQVPRDGDNNSEQWTTVDPNKTNIRARYTPCCFLVPNSSSLTLHGIVSEQDG